MQLPEDTHLAYIVSHEAWYARALPDSRPEINVMAAATGGGVAWEFTVEEVDLGSHGPAIRVKVFDDAFEAFAQIPEFFAALAAGQAGTLGDLREILDSMGAADETQRHSRYGEIPEKATPARIRKAIAAALPGSEADVRLAAALATTAVMRVLGAGDDRR
jgi:hypothetical protein